MVMGRPVCRVTSATVSRVLRITVSFSSNPWSSVSVNPPAQRTIRNDPSVNVNG
jgi:hypothetical protein